LAIRRKSRLSGNARGKILPDEFRARDPILLGKNIVLVAGNPDKNFNPSN